MQLDSIPMTTSPPTGSELPGLGTMRSFRDSQAPKPDLLKTVSPPTVRNHDPSLARPYYEMLTQCLGSTGLATRASMPRVAKALSVLCARYPARRRLRHRRHLRLSLLCRLLCTEVAGVGRACWRERVEQSQPGVIPGAILFPWPLIGQVQGCGQFVPRGAVLLWNSFVLSDSHSFLAYMSEM